MRTYVFAANYQHFGHWCRISGISKGNPNYQYVSSIEKLLGLSAEDAQFIFYETWREHPDSERLYQQYRIIESYRGIKAIPIDRSPQVESDGIFTAKFWKATAERVVRAFAAGIIALNVTNVTDATSIGWKTVLMAGVAGAGVSLLMALVGSRFGDDTTDPSFIKKEEK